MCACVNMVVMMTMVVHVCVEEHHVHWIFGGRQSKVWWDA